MGPKKRASQSTRSSRVGKSVELIENTEESHVEEPTPAHPPKFFNPLPDRFNSVVDKLIDIENVDTQDIAAYVECILGKPYFDDPFSLWFADSLLVHVVNFRDSLDHHYGRLLTSWLEGEMLLIEGKVYEHKGVRISRGCIKVRLVSDQLLEQKDFFNVMRGMFVATHGRILQGEPLLSWNSTVQRTEQANRLPTEWEAMLSKSTLASLNTQQSVSKKSVTPSIKSMRILRKSETKGSKGKMLSMKNTASSIGPTISESPEEDSFSLSLINPIDAFDVIIKVTYAMFGDAHRYDLMYSILKSPFDSEDNNNPSENLDALNTEADIYLDVCTLDKC